MIKVLSLTDSCVQPPSMTSGQTGTKADIVSKLDRLSFGPTTTRTVLANLLTREEDPDFLYFLYCTDWPYTDIIKSSIQTKNLVCLPSLIIS